MSRWLANLVLLLVALIWGTTFVAQRLGMDHIGPWAYTGMRFLMGALLITPLAFREIKHAQQQQQHPWRDLPQWVLLGIVLTSGAVMQQIGIMSTSVSNAGFLTALYVPLVPFLAWVIRKEKPTWMTWPAALSSLIGTFFLSGGELNTLNHGDYWILASTLFWGIHVLWVSELVLQARTPVLIALTQFTVCGSVCSVIAALHETTSMANLLSALPAIAYGGVLSVGIAYTLQIVAQRYTKPADAAVLLSSEILFAALAAALVMGERLSAAQWFGGLLILTALLLVQLGIRHNHD